MKTLQGKDPNKCTLSCFYFPNLNNGTESAIMAMGHHTLADGISLMQAFYKISDTIKQGEYPFFIK